MYKSIFILLTVLFALHAKADIIKCSFTEPFYNTQYSMAQQSLRMTHFDGTVTVIKNVSFQIFDSGKFELWNKDNKLLMRLNLNYKGSNGMSDAIYPYTGIAVRRLNNYGTHRGGCTSNFLHEVGGE